MPLPSRRQPSDAERQFTYGVESKIATFSGPLMAEAEQTNWTGGSMKNDRKTIFPLRP